MKFSSRYRTPESPDAELLVIYGHEGGFSSNPHLRTLDARLGGYISNLYSLGMFTGRMNQIVTIFPADREPAAKVLLAGLGRKAGLRLETLREYGGTIGGRLAELGSRSCTVYLPDAAKSSVSAAQLGQAVTEGILLGSFAITDFKSSARETIFPDQVVLSPASRASAAGVNKGGEIGEITAWAQTAARSMVSSPPAEMTPAMLAKQAGQFASENGFKCSVLSVADMRRLKMGALPAVGAGSEQPPKLIVVEYRGRGAKKNSICLVGKGITFDSGGYSLKQPADMVDMKADMAGAACVLTAITAAARLNLPIHVFGIVPAAENLVSGRSYKPGDILRSYSGKTIEVTNTDAEGRLILADALGYADTFKPGALVDIATLTSATKIALGYTGAGYFANDERLAARIASASERSGERVWRMPLWEPYQEYIKSDLADLKNSAGKVGAFCTAAAFLANFVGHNKWAHIDIAGMDVDVKGGSYIHKGASGFGARLLIELLRKW